MKKLLLIVVGLFVSMVSMAQVPNLINYQAVVRDDAGASIVSTTVGVEVSILVSSPSGLVAYSETHSPMTNQYGLMNFRIGEGTVTAGDFASIAWGSNDFYLQVAVDPLGGSAYTITSTSQLVAVPYAFHAETVENADDADADPANEAISAYTLNVSNELEITEGGTVWTVDLSGLVDDADSDPNNETITSTSFAGSTLTIVEAGTTHDITLTGLGDDADADPDNEAQTLSKAGSTVTLSDVGGVGGGSFNDEVDDADADPNNEAQTISLAGSTVTLTDVGGTGGGSFSINDADADPDNEAQTISLAGSTVTLTDVGGTGGGSFSIDDADADDSNELITDVSLSGTNLEITEDGTVHSVDLAALATGGTEYHIGQKVFGGTVFWVDSTGEHGLICANEILPDVFWDGFDGVSNQTNFGLVNYDATDEYDGASNTANIVAHWGSTTPGWNYAALSADTYSITQGGTTYSDWYLPSLWELDMLMQVRYATGIPTSAHLVTHFWSSTEPIAATGSSALSYTIAGNTINAVESQISNGFVWPIRKF
ncbi:MAG: hypothetical protein MK078_17730 [Crocinitomicaceae bacterium]|nr:hypothetical protein [Crocinitomicaceae bacterium]